VAHVLRYDGTPYEVLEFSPYGYDERQYCSPGFNLPVGCLMRSVWGQFPEYHSSADDLAFVRPQALAKSFSICLAVFDLLEHNRLYTSTNPCGEPALGRRGLYGATAADNLAKLWVLNLADGDHTLLDMADRAGLSFATISRAADTLLEHGLLVAADDTACH
jgi:aminopeptidase-like protein